MSDVKVLSLFSGIGGLDLGLERAGMTIVGQVEKNVLCRRILAKHWPDVPRHEDVVTASSWWRARGNAPVDLVCGGFPCQDISNAHTNGKREALDGSQSGLWLSFYNTVQAIRPTWVIAENVAAWHRWVPRVRSDLHTIGYATVPMELSAGALGAPHRRPRVFVVAHPYGEGQSLRAFYEALACLRPVPRDRGYWREPFTGTVRVVDGASARMDRLRAIGNSVVPQVAEAIGRAVMAA